MDRRPVCPAGWDLDQGLVDEHGNGVQIASTNLQTETLGLQRDSSAAGEGIENCRRIAIIALADLGSSSVEYAIVRRVLPFDEPFEYVEKTVALGVLRRLVWVVLRVSRRIVHKLGEEHCAAGCEGSL